MRSCLWANEADAKSIRDACDYVKNLPYPSYIYVFPMSLKEPAREKAETDLTLRYKKKYGVEWDKDPNLPANLP